MLSNSCGNVKLSTSSVSGKRTLQTQADFVWALPAWVSPGSGNLGAELVYAWENFYNLADTVDSSPPNRWILFQRIQCNPPVAASSLPMRYDYRFSPISLSPLNKIVNPCAVSGTGVVIVTLSIYIYDSFSHGAIYQNSSSTCLKGNTMGYSIPLAQGRASGWIDIHLAVRFQPAL